LFAQSTSILWRYLFNSVGFLILPAHLNLFQMKKFATLFFLLFLFQSAIAQSKYSISTRLLMHDLAPYAEKSARDVPQKLWRTYGLHQRNGQLCAMVAIKTNDAMYSADNLSSIGAVQNSRFIGLASVDCPVNKLQDLAQMPGVIFLDAGVDDAPMLELARKDTHTDSAKAGLGLPKAVSGKNVVVAVIDWGFDYTHPNYYSSDLQDYRVVRVWDQNLDNGTPPAGFSYGGEHATQADILAAEHDDPYVFGLGSHGTHTSGIAAGGGAGTNNVGVAHDAELILLPYRRGAAGLFDGMTYVKNYANSQGKPFVFNMSTGSHLGPHDGTSLKNQAISQIVGPGAVFVGSAGNNGQNNFHLSHTFGGNDTVISTVSAGSNPNTEWGSTFAIWGAPNTPLKLAFSLLSTTADTLYTSPFYLSADEPLIDSSFIFGGDSLQFRLLGIAQDPSNNKANFRLEVRNKTGRALAIHISGQQGRVDVWHNIRLDERYTNWGINLRGAPTGNTPIAGYKFGDADYGVGEPAGVGPSVISVGAYRSEEKLFTGTVVYGDLASFSSRGPTVDGRTKPDITGPGVSVNSAISSFDPSASSPFPAVIFNGKNYYFTQYSGTSMSGPMVCGIVALMLEANPDLTWNDTRDIIRNTARTDSKTGTIPAGGSLVWGWGKVNAWAAVNEAFNQVSVKSFVKNGSRAVVFPNPASSALVHLNASNYPPGAYQVVISDASGRPIATENYSHSIVENWVLPTNKLSNGIYIVTVTRGNATIDVLRMVITR